MAISAKFVFANAMLFWFFVTILYMILIANFDLYLYLSLSLLGMLIVLELSYNPFIRPYYAHKLWKITIAGYGVFFLIVCEKILESISL